MQIVKAYTDIWSPILGDGWQKANEAAPLREIAITSFDGLKTVDGVINGITMKVPITKLYSDRNRSKLKRSALKPLWGGK